MDLPILAVCLARTHLGAGEHATARAVASRALANRATPARDRIELFLIDAAAAIRTGDEESAADMTRQAVAIYEETGALRPFLIVPPGELRELLSLAGRGLAAEDLAKVLLLAAVQPARVEVIKLTKRERALLLALESTASRQDIADDQYVTLHTVKAQLNTLYRKLGSGTRAEAIEKAYEYG